MKKYNKIICYEEEQKRSTSEEIIHNDWGKNETRQPKKE